MTADNNKLDMFYGFWKYFGVMGVFLTGIAITWWGINIMLYDWVYITNSMGFIGNITLLPFAVGVVLAWMGLVEFLRIIRE